ncbi:hypothetical protein [Mesorhizobium sp. M1163]|uniref:hypothetical protein n=1 Tax=Mesorhizobium sp. M1163 TaxID=2957065 RepID=UPI00333CB06F
MATIDGCAIGHRQSPTDLCADFHPMGGLTRLDGFVADPANNDIVLWGLKEADAAPLMLDDFIVAIRAAHGEYTVIENGQNVIYQPGISIDADNSIWPILSKINNLQDPRQKLQYQRVCATPMHLRVDGMPRHTRVSDILLAADFRMKLVNEGLATIPIRDFFKGINMRGIERDIVQAKTGAAYKRPRYDFDRYWFRAGSFTFQTTPRGETVFLDTAQVILSQQTQNMANGKMVNGGINPDQQAYVCDWNSRMEDTFKAEQIWRQMYNVFRHFAIARIIADRHALQTVDFPSDSLLRRHEVKFVYVPDSLPGQSFLTPVKVGDVSWVAGICGGVSIDFDGSNVRQEDSTPISDEVPRSVLSTRPHAQSVGWDI